MVGAQKCAKTKVATSIEFNRCKGHVKITEHQEMSSNDIETASCFLYQGINVDMDGGCNEGTNMMAGNAL